MVYVLNIKIKNYKNNHIDNKHNSYNNHSIQKNYNNNHGNSKGNNNNANNKIIPLYRSGNLLCISAKALHESQLDEQQHQNLYIIYPKTNPDINRNNPNFDPIPNNTSFDPYIDQNIDPNIEHEINPYIILNQLEVLKKCNIKKIIFLFDIKKFESKQFQP